jgi:iron complex transport system permease protein
VTSKAAIAWVVLLASLAGAVVLRLLAGDGQGLHWPEDAMVWDLRFHRLWSGLLVGTCLAIGGVLLQSLLRNPLASPDLIGPTAGAGLAVMVRAYLLHAAGIAATAAESGAASNGPAALAGAIVALAIVYSLSQRRGMVDPVSLVLIGVIVSVVCGAGTMFLGQLLPDGGYRVSRWAIGSISEGVSDTALWVVTAGGLLGLLGGVTLGPAMDVASLSDDEAASTGLNLARLRIKLFVLSGILTAGAVVLAGPVGFVGLVCPHVVRLLIGPSHRALVIGSAIAGATLVVGADGLTRALTPPGMSLMPVGVLTALLGGPVFIVLLRADRTA